MVFPAERWSSWSETETIPMAFNIEVIYLMANMNRLAKA